MESFRICKQAQEIVTGEVDYFCYKWNLIDH